MTVMFYEPWKQFMHVTKFGKHPDKQHVYLKTTGIIIYDESKLTLYTKQIIDRGVFEKRDIIE